MRIDRFQDFVCQAYRQAPEVTSAEPYSNSSRPFGIEIKLATGTTVRHAITRVSIDGEDLSAPEQPVEGEPPAPADERPQPAGPRDRQTAAFLAAVIGGTGNPELERVYSYDETSLNPGVGIDFHSGAKIHLLLVS